MRHRYLSLREQLLSALVIVVIVMGSYVGLRFMSANQVIADLKKSAASTQKRLTKARIPDEPLEDIDELTKKLDDLENAMALKREQADLLQQRLAPTGSQSLIVRISQLAQDSGVHIRSNEKLEVEAPKPDMLSKVSKKLKKKFSKGKQIEEQPVLLPETAGWVMRMSKGTLFERPLQRIELEGTYSAIHQFIYGLDNLPYQVTVLRLKLEKVAILSPPGYPQMLLAELVLAL